MTKVNDEYDSQASSYDNFIRKLVPGYDFFISVTPLLMNNPTSVLDLGCGTGNSSAGIKNLYADAKLTCVDTSQEMLKIAESRIEGNFIQSNIEDFQPKQKFDAVISTMVMHNVQAIEKRQSVYKMISDSLNPGGVYVTSDIIVGENDITYSLYIKMWRNFMLNNLTEEEVDGKWLPLHKEKDKPLTLSKQIEMISRAGFKSIEIINKNINFVMIAAFK